RLLVSWPIRFIKALNNTVSIPPCAVQLFLAGWTCKARPRHCDEAARYSSPHRGGCWTTWNNATFHWRRLVCWCLMKQIACWIWAFCPICRVLCVPCQRSVRDYYFLQLSAERSDV